MKTMPELIIDFKDWFSTFQGVDFADWLNSQDKKTIEDTIMDFLENTREETYSKNLKLSKRIYQELRK